MAEWIIDDEGNEVMELIRCKYCAHYHHGFNCDLLQKPMFTDDSYFCASGERASNIVKDSYSVRIDRIDTGNVSETIRKIERSKQDDPD